MIANALVLVTVTAGALLVGKLIGWILLWAAKHSRHEFYLQETKQRCQNGINAVAVTGALYFALPATAGPLARHGLLRHILLIALIASVGWLVLKKLRAAEEALFTRYPADVPEFRRARRARTKLQVIRRLTAILTVVFTVGAVLMTIPQVRQLGSTLLTSAGLLGIIISIAGQSTLAPAAAGIQITFSDSLRVDDIVVVDGEWGRIEQIRLTHVVLRAWDDRRLILPTTYFTTKSYQNWTRFDTPILATVELQLDYTARLQDVRTETQRIIEMSPFWDRQHWQVQMIDVSPPATTVRVSVSAADGPNAWNLRCELREGLITYLRDVHPQWIPRIRNAYQP
ncbi:Mechanosensitive ion channel [Micromonospora pattaloongensis]|uniref:Mechanosensitive ion channel n=1 Tax=Micromonospora pattaloongensis TaxID=405436 RepID=A0A1H3NYT5_9ACTN|nr:mechanosensitive ion channel domain-containing protein [Micromonospora pattaloongensis]SDY94037.1 Mechanosensitive ion channel [Micromonospora pattaloongensis]